MNAGEKVRRHQRSVGHAKNSAVEGEHEKRDHKAHAGQCNCDLNHSESIDCNFLMPGECSEHRRTATRKPEAERRATTPAELYSYRGPFLSLICGEGLCKADIGW